LHSQDKLKALAKEKEDLEQALSEAERKLNAADTEKEASDERIKSLEQSLTDSEARLKVRQHLAFEECHPIICLSKDASSLSIMAPPSRFPLNETFCHVCRKLWQRFQSWSGF
jgi:hypothetical protein